MGSVESWILDFANLGLAIKTYHARLVAPISTASKMKRKEPESAEPKNPDSILTDMIIMLTKLLQTSQTNQSEEPNIEVLKEENEVLRNFLTGFKSILQQRESKKMKYEHENLLNATRIHVEFMLSLRQDRPKRLVSLDEGIESSILEVYNHCAEWGAVEQKTILAWAERLLVKGESEGMSMKDLRGLLNEANKIINDV